MYTCCKKESLPGNNKDTKKKSKDYCSIDIHNYFHTPVTPEMYEPASF